MLKSSTMHSVEDYRTWVDEITGSADEDRSHVSQVAREKALDNLPPSFPCVAVLAIGPGESGPYCAVDFVPIAADR